MLSFFTSKQSRGTKGKDEPAPQPPSPPPSKGTEFSKETGLVLDALAAVLQHFGKNAFDTGVRTEAEVRALVQGWRMHATIGAPRPGYADDKSTAGVFYRDWKGLVQFFGEHRRDEAKYVGRTIEDFRTVTWAFVGAVHSVIVHDQEESQSVKDQVARMRAAAESNSPDRMKREALSALEVMENILEQRKARQHEQFSKLADKLKALGRELEDARRESAVDPMTGLANRKAFDEYITRSIELHSLLGQPATLMMIDLDHFKGINDSFGHPAGDAVLCEVANALSRTFLRRVDFVARYGGDEFAVILQETDLESAQVLADRLRRQIAEMRAIEVPEGVTPPTPTLSIGIGELRVGDQAVDWIKRADAGLYHAKRSGRDRSEAFSA